MGILPVVYHAMFTYCYWLVCFNVVITHGNFVCLDSYASTTFRPIMYLGIHDDLQRRSIYATYDVVHSVTLWSITQPHTLSTAQLYSLFI